MAEDAIAVLRNLGVEHADFVGHSMGGYITQTVEALAPDLVRSKTLLNTSPGGPGSLPVPKETQDLWAKATEESARETAHITDPKKQADEKLRLFVEKTMHLAFPKNWIATKANQVRYAKLVKARLAVPTSVEARAAQKNAADTFVAEGLTPVKAANSPVMATRDVEYLPVLEAPALVIGSRDDRVVPGSNSEAFQRLLPRSKLVMFDEGGHNVLLVKPKEVIALIRDHLASVQ
jgi:pimeloyl-ACP methyl ester carboxylesterase